MTKLTGTPKQIVWAESIRESYQATAAELRNAIEVLKNTEHTEITLHDPIVGDYTHREYTSKTTTQHDIAIHKAMNWASGKKTHKIASKIIDVEKQLLEQGVEHTSRLARAKVFEEILEQMEIALLEQTSAKYWIENR